MKTVSNFVKSEKNLFKDCVSSFLPAYAIVPVIQPGLNFSRILVKEGDVLQEGQVIGVCSKEENDNDVSINIHSSIPGKVVGFDECTLEDGRVAKALKIQLQGAFSFLGKKLEKRDWDMFSSQDILQEFNRQGVVNTFEKGGLLAEEIKSCNLKDGRFLVVRMFDEDPSRMTDQFLAVNMTERLMEGAFIVAKAMNATGIVFVCPKKNKVNLDLSVMGKIPTLCIETDTGRYPCGYRKSLIHVVKKAAKTTKDKFFMSVNHKCIFIDPQTAISAYEAVVLGQPVLYRYVHVTGNSLRSSGLLKVRIGTTIGHLAEQLGGFRKKTVKIVINGMLTGRSVATMDTPVTNMVKSVCFVPAADLGDQHMSNCTRCGNCRSICPEGIYPDLLFRHSTGGKLVGSDLLATSNLCSDCNLCNSVCPSRLPLSQTIALLRENDYE